MACLPRGSKYPINGVLGAEYYNLNVLLVPEAPMFG